MKTDFGPVRLIPGSKSGRYPFCHSIYLEASTRVLIDPASDPERLAELGRKPGVDAVWLSHYHEDHMMFLNLFEDRPIWIAEPDSPPLTGLGTFLDYYGINNPRLRDFFAEMLVQQFNYRPRRPARFFQGEEIIDLGGLTVEVIPTPGHTPGHCSFYFREPETLFLGDYDLTSFGPWYGDAYSSLEDTINSVERLRRIPARTWLASHEQGVFETEPGEAWDKYLGVIKYREDRLLDLLKEPRNMEQIVEARIVYGKIKEPKEFFDIGEEGHMAKHLERLLNLGLVVREGDCYWRR
ncbi:MAG: MBL fold metallo-hydrolase [Thermodesulfobacteriota bacterium]